MSHRAAAALPGTAEAQRLIPALAARGWTIGVAESLTGGLVTAALTAVPGASRVVRGGVVAYATGVKHTLLGVGADLLERVGPVDAEVARRLAEGARAALALQGRPADVGVATTGVAGPDPQDGAAVGTVFVAVATPAGTRVERLALSGERARIRADSVRAALRLVLDAVCATPLPEE